MIEEYRKEFSSMRKLVIAYLLMIPPLGFWGAHRFYLNKIGTGLLWFFTGAFFFLGYIYDLITLPAQVRDFNDRVLGRSARERNYIDPEVEQAYYRVHRTTGTPSAATPVKPKELPEKQVIQVARKHGGKITIADVVAESDLSIDQAESILKKLAVKGYAGMRVTESGLVVYEFNELVHRDEV